MQTDTIGEGRRRDGARILNARLPEKMHERFTARLAADGLTMTEGARAAIAAWLDGGGGAPAVAPAPPTNPLRSMREAAGLSQAQAAARCGVTRGAWANDEKAAKVTPAKLARVRKAMGVGT